jgi:cyclophilin family peptidyl-prolyl cis-trans isomerase
VLFLKGLNKKCSIILGMSSKKNVKVKTYNPKKQGKRQMQIAGVIIAVIIIAFVGYVVATHLGPSQPLSNQKSTPSPSPTTSASPTSSSSPYPTVTMLTSPAGEYSTSSTKVLFITSKGDIVIQMRNDKPITTSNFVNLVKEGYYNNTIFQRVIAGFMIQGGEGKTTQPTITNLETGDGNSNLNMTIAMANAGGTSTASTQFFINVADNSDLDSGYTVFGQVIYGQNVVMAISNAPVGYSSEYQANVLPTPTITLIGAVIMP